MLWGMIERISRQAGMGDCNSMMWAVFTAMFASLADTETSVEETGDVATEIRLAAAARESFTKSQIQGTATA